MITPNSGFIPLNKGHVAGEKGVFSRYSVYLAKTDMPIMIDGTASECAKALGRSRNSFYTMIHRVRNGKNKKYVVYQRMLDEPEEDLES